MDLSYTLFLYHCCSISSPIPSAYKFKGRFYKDVFRSVVLVIRNVVCVCFHLKFMAFFRLMLLSARLK